MLLSITLSVAQEYRESEIGGYIQEDASSLTEGTVYLRNATGYNREGFLVFSVNEDTEVSSVELQLYPSSIKNNETTQIDFYAIAGDQVTDMTWETRPTEDLETLGSEDLASDAAILSLDITDYYNSLVTAGNVSYFTIRIVSETTNAFVQFVSTTSGDTDSRPVLKVITDCEDYSVEKDTIVCAGSNPVIAGEVRTEDGTYVASLTRTCGADSILTYYATFIADGTDTESVTICEGESYEGYTESGTYTVSISSDNGACTQATNLILTVMEAPAVDLGEDVSLREGTTVTLDAGSGYAAYLWSDGSTGQTLTISDETISAGDEIIVTVTNDNGCTDSDTVVVTLIENVVSPSYDGYVREYDDAYYNTTALEVKYDQYGDLNNPGNAPFWSRESYLAFDLSDLDVSIKNVKLRLYLYNITFVDETDNDDISVDFSIAEGLYDESIIWSTKPSSSAYTAVTTVTVSEDDAGSFIEVDLDEYLQENIIGDADQFSVKISCYSDPNSTMVKFRSMDYTTEAQQPRLTFEVDDDDPVVTGVSDEQEVQFSVYPNPATDRLLVQGADNAKLITIHDLTGRTQWYGREVPTQGVDVSGLTPGIYVLTVCGDTYVSALRFVKQ